jgi:hypothetical protein
VVGILNSGPGDSPLLEARAIWIWFITVVNLSLNLFLSLDTDNISNTIITVHQGELFPNLQGEAAHRALFYWFSMSLQMPSQVIISIYLPDNYQGRRYYGPKSCTSNRYCTKSFCQRNCSFVTNQIPVDIQGSKLNESWKEHSNLPFCWH